jgi:hypothetical protein
MGANWQGNFTPYHCLMCLNLVAMGEAWATPPFFKCVFVSKKNRRKRCHHNVSKQRSFAPHHWWAPPPPCFYVCLFIKEEGASVTITMFSIMQLWRSFNSFFFFFFFFWLWV